MCIISQRPEPCNHYECMLFYLSGGMAQPPTQTPFNTQNFLTAIENHNSLLQSIVEQNSRTYQIMEGFGKVLEEKAIFASGFRHSDLVMVENSVEPKLLELMCDQKEFAYYLSPESTVPVPAFKERAFSLEVSLKDLSGNLVFLNEHSRFKLALLTQDEPPIQLKTNISGKKILRGTCEAEMQDDGYIKFVNVVINEVSSHYSKDSFLLVVFNLTSEEVKPLILPDVIVRARKPLRKRQR